MCKAGVRCAQGESALTEYQKGTVGMSLLYSIIQ